MQLYFNYLQAQFFVFVDFDIPYFVRIADCFLEFVATIFLELLKEGRIAVDIFSLADTFSPVPFVKFHIVFDDAVADLLIEDILILPNLKVLRLACLQLADFPHAHQQFHGIGVHLLVESFLEKIESRQLLDDCLHEIDLLFLADQIQRTMPVVFDVE